MRTLLSTVVLALVAAVCLGTFADDAHAQYYGVRYSEKVSTVLKTAIGSTQPAPFGIKVASGDGSKFANVGTYFILTLDAANSTNATAIEEILVRYISGDSLLVLARGTNVAANRPQQAWLLNSYLGIRVSYVVIAQIQDTLIKRMAMLDSVAHLADSTRALLPSQSGKSGKVLSTNGTNLFWTSAAGAVSSVTAVAPLTGGVITSSGSIGIPIADASHTGALLYTDWNTLMAKQNALPSLVAGEILSNDGTNYLWTPIGAGTVTSVSGTGGTTGLTVTNVPITTSGTFTLGGTLVVANGGTGAGTRAQALLNLLPSISGHVGEYLRILPLDSSIVWDTASGGGGGGSGSVTSIDVAGGTTGLTTSGGPVTTSGTITLAGTLSDTNGGTQQSSWTKGDLLYASNTNALAKLAIGTTGKVLTVNSGLPSWQTPTTGTVTSAGLTMPAEFSVASSPVTSSGTIAVTKVSQAQNLVYAAPDTGAGLPYFRVLAATDIPNLPASVLTSGTLAVARGGTSFGSYTTGDLLYASSSSVLSKLAVGGAHTTVHGGSAPTYSAVDLASDITGTLQVANGGTGLVTLTSHAIQIGNGTSSPTQLALGTSTTILHGAAAGDPTWSAVSLTADVTGTLPVANGGTSFGSYTTGDLLYASSSSVLAKLGIGTSAQVLTVSGGAPSWQTFSALTNPMTTTGDMIYSSSGSTPASLAAGTAAQFLIGGPAPAWGSTLFAAAAGLGTTSTDGLVLKDSTAATSGVTSNYSPRLRLTGTAWKSNVTAASQTDDWIIENQPLTGTTATTSNLVFSSQIAGGGYAAKLAVGSGGSLSLGGSQIFSSNSTLASGVTGSSLVSVSTITTGTWHGSVVDETHGGTGQSGYSSGDMLYASGASTLSTRAIGADNTVLEAVSGAPAWVAPLNPYGFVFGSTAALTVGVTSGYFSPFGVAQTSAASENTTHEMLVVSPCQATNLYLQTNAAPGGGNLHTMQLFRSTNQGATWNVTPLAVTISGGSATSAQDVADTVSLNAGDLISLEDHSSISSSATSGTWGLHLIEPTNISGVYNTVTASTSIAADQQKTIGSTAVQTCDGSNSYISPSVSTYAGRVAYQNTSGAGVTAQTVTIQNTKVTASSVIIVSVEKDGHSTGGIFYVANVTSGSRSAGASFQLDLQTKGTTQILNTAGFTIDYIIVN